MNEEEWKDVTGFEGKYLISNHGRLKSIGGKYKKSMPDGYITVGCTDNLGYKAIKVGRMNNRGSKHGMSKLNESQVIKIRKLYWDKGLTQQSIADKFGICRRQIGDIVNRVNWGWLIGPCQ